MGPEAPGCIIVVGNIRPVLSVGVVPRNASTCNPETCVRQRNPFAASTIDKCTQFDCQLHCLTGRCCVLRWLVLLFSTCCA